MAAAMAATMVVGPLVKIVMEKLSSELLNQYKVMKGMERQHDILRRKLLLVLDIITDAEHAAPDSEQAAACRAGAAAWLEDIKKVAYKANELFDEFKYEALRRKAKKEGHYNDLGFSMVKLFPTNNSFVFRKRMGRKLHRIVQDIDALIAEKNTFGFQNQQQQPVSNQWREMDGGIFDLNKITSRSREKDKKNIIDILVAQANNADLTVVPIVGLGGLGKTTLAQLVYSNPEIEKHFDVLLWVCVSHNFDVDSLAKSIVDAAPEKKDDGTEDALKKKIDSTKAAAPKKKKTPLDILQDVVSGQRYLLVLDDVWTREVRKWEKLKASLEHGGMGSVVMTTTRDKRVAEIMGSVEAYQLEALEDKYIKEIIETRAFSCFQRKEDRPAVLVNMVGEIVKRCVGSPLAATALGSVLRTKTSEEEWKDVSSRSSICTEETGILPILKLSYNNLPSHMKQCFSFCAIFPKDYDIDVDKLIQLWIAHGFIIEEKQVRLETIGKQIFKELASMSFFQDVKQVQPSTIKETVDSGLCYSRTTCKIHDLMHDVALSVMQKECALATEEPSHSQSNWLPNTARHLFLSCEKPEEKMNSSLENSSPAIQTLLCDGYMVSSLQHLSKYCSLQALQLCSYRRSFPLKSKHLHHLSNVGELGNLNLGGQLELRHLANVTQENAEAANFRDSDSSLAFPNLKELTLDYLCCLERWWEIGDDGIKGEEIMFPRLEKLFITRCEMLRSLPGHPTFLTSRMLLFMWVARHMTSLTNMELTSLEVITETTSAAAKHNLSILSSDVLVHWPEKELEGLVSLRRLQTGCCKNLTDMHKLLRAINIVRNKSVPATPRVSADMDCKSLVEVFNIPASLRRMQISDCSKLESIYGRRLHQGQSASLIHQEHLEELRLIGCHGLRGSSVFPVLKVLEIEHCGGLTSLEFPCHPTDVPQAYSSLQHLRIFVCPDMKTLPTSLQQRLGSLQWEYIDAHCYGNRPRPIPILLKPKTWNMSSAKIRELQTELFKEVCDIEIRIHCWNLTCVLSCKR
uniref:NBS-LRR disease resistance protein n=1 Tax=Dasypyrum villosum TaxID=40247 RepID=A0A8K1IB31_9POAL|nr:NBS-LRR disease resistance protein [Dasypyrum villosum]